MVDEKPPGYRSTAFGPVRKNCVNLIPSLETKFARPVLKSRWCQPFRSYRVRDSSTLYHKLFKIDMAAENGLSILSFQNQCLLQSLDPCSCSPCCVWVTSGRTFLGFVKSAYLRRPSTVEMLSSSTSALKRPGAIYRVHHRY